MTLLEIIHLYVYAIASYKWICAITTSQRTFDFSFSKMIDDHPNKLVISKRLEILLITTERNKNRQNGRISESIVVA